MSINLPEQDKLVEVGEINTERGLQAKRNLFVFTATIIIIHFNSAIDFTDLTLFGISPFQNNANSSFGWLIVITLYLVINWIYHYLQGWGIWRTNLDALFKRRPLKTLFNYKVENPSNGYTSRYYQLEENASLYTVYEYSQPTGHAESRAEKSHYRRSSIWLVRRQIIMFVLGVVVLAGMSLTTLIVLAGNYIDPPKTAEYSWFHE